MYEDFLWNNYVDYQPTAVDRQRLPFHLCTPSHKSEKGYQVRAFLNIY